MSIHCICISDPALIIIFRDVFSQLKQNRIPSKLSSSTGSADVKSNWNSSHIFVPNYCVDKSIELAFGTGSKFRFSYLSLMAQDK